MKSAECLDMDNPDKTCSDDDASTDISHELPPSRIALSTMLLLWPRIRFLRITGNFSL